MEALTEEIAFEVKMELRVTDRSIREKNDPRYIQYLLTIPDNIPTATRSFIVGKPDDIGIQVINACSTALMAHSNVFRSMLMKSKLADAEPVVIDDIQPRTFQDMLVFMYGHNTVSEMTIEESVDLLYAAEKYMVDELKKVLATHISSLVTLDNIFILLQRPECFNQETLKKKINEKVQLETPALLSHQKYLDLNAYALLYILQQDSLKVSEIVLWKAVLKWAKHQAQTDTGSILRKLLLEHIKYIRFCTLAWTDFVKEVVLTDILTEHEVFLINKTFGSNIEQQNLTSVCNKLTQRKQECPKLKPPIGRGRGLL